MNPVPTPAAEAKSEDSPAARRIRLASILVLAAATAFVGWRTLRSAPSAREPASAFYYVRDQVLRGDGLAAWRTLLPEGREKYLRFLKAMETEETPIAKAWRLRTGVSAKDIPHMPPEEILAKEYLSVAETMLRGATVYRTDVVDADTAIIYILARDGEERSWLVRKVDGLWKVSDPLPLITAQGEYTSGPRKFRIPDYDAGSPGKNR